MRKKLTWIIVLHTERKQKKKYKNRRKKKKRKKKKKELKATSFPHLSQVNPDQIDECREAK